MSFFPGKARLYPILDLENSTNIDDLHKPLTLWQECGITYYQLRAKQLQASEYLQLAQNLCQAHPKLHILANDFAEQALDHPSVFSGLHLGQEDWTQLNIDVKRHLIERKRSASPFVAGLSTHNALQMEHALNQDKQARQHISWDYLALGPCFTTTSKNASTLPALSDTVLAKAIITFAKLSTSKQTLVLIGGIKNNNIAPLLQLVSKLLDNRTKIAIASIQAIRNRDELIRILGKLLSVSTL